MADVSSLISSSSIDTLVQTYKTSLQKPVTVLQDKRTSLNARLSALADLKTKLNALFSTAKDLSQTGVTSKFSLFGVSSTLPAIATASATGSAVLGSHSLLVTQLAKADTILSSSAVSTGTSIVDAEGAGAKTIRLTVNGTDTDVNVTLNAGDSNSTTLSNIASAINQSGSAVSASVVAVTPTTSRLVISARNTGSSNSISLSNVSGTLLDNLGLTSSVISGRTTSTATTAGYIHTDANLLDSKFNIDGIDVVRGKNTVNDVLPGITLELKGVQTPSDQPVSLTVGYDKDKVRQSIEQFIKNYNDAISYITSKTAIDPTKNIKEIFAGDSTVISLRFRLRTMVSGSVSSVAAGNPSVLSQIGIKMAADGTLSISDSAKLDESITTDAKQVADLFNSTDGIAIRLKAALDGFVSVTGIIDKTRDGVSNQISTLNNRIKRANADIDAKTARYRTEFAKLQSTLTVLMQQQQFIQSIIDSVSSG